MSSATCLAKVSGPHLLSLQKKLLEGADERVRRDRASAFDSARNSTAVFVAFHMRLVLVCVTLESVCDS